MPAWPCASAGDPVLYLQNPPGVDAQRPAGHARCARNQLNQRSFERVGDPDIQTRIAQYEMAFRMQASVPELADLSKESPATAGPVRTGREDAGLFRLQRAAGPAAGRARACASCRSCTAAGIRTGTFRTSWATSASTPTRHCAALVQDLKQRGLLDDVLVVWGGEFGRTVYSQGTLTHDNYGRDHHPRNFCMWMAGGGIKGGIVHGETDDFSYNPVADPVHINDINATILHCLGIDHERFSLKFQGLDQRLTGVESVSVVKKLLA